MTAEPKQVVVFIDYQNVYQGARRCFRPDTASHVDGQIQPRLTALKLKGADRVERELREVRVYRGLPSNRRDPKGYRASHRQVDLWSNQPLVRPITRGLNYRNPKSPKEKGVDVAIAVDFVVMAVRGEYDVGILFSCDTDLLPALEAVATLDPEMRPQIEVASWSNGNPQDARPLRLSPEFGGGPPAHLLRATDYDSVHDPTDYNAPRRRR